MFIKTPKPHFVLVAALLAFIALVSTACAFNSVDVSTISPVIDITPTQEELDQFPMDGGISVNEPCDELLDEISRVEMHDGYIRYLGMKVQSDRSKVYGSFDMSLGAEQDML